MSSPSSPADPRSPPPAATADDPLAAWDFSLPPEQIAVFPPATRDGGRLLLVGQPPARPHRHLRIPDLVAELRAGDLLVVNDVRVHKARLRCERASGGAVEVLLTNPGPDDTWEALARPGRRLKEGESVRCGPGHVDLVARRQDGSWLVRCRPDVDTLTAAAGEVPLPPYLARAPVADDEHRYQTVYARPGEHRAAAAPTAGLHFTPALLEALAARGVERASVSLEVGAGTFRPLDPAALDRGELHAERYHLPAPTWEAVARTRAAGGRIVAVGTTATRVLESATGPGPGVTRLFIRPGYRFRNVDVLLTNLHLPRSSLLMLVAAFGGEAAVRDAYRAAVDERYRFFSYGDAMLLHRAAGP